MPDIVLEGRRVVNNITRAASLFLVKTLYSFALALLLLALPAAYPFQPIQLTLISSLTIGIPSFFLALEPNRERIRGGFLETVLRRAIPGAAGVTVCAVIAMMTVRFGWPQAVGSTLATLSAGAIGLGILLRVCRPFNLLRGTLWLVMTLCFIGNVLVLGKVYFLVTLTLEQCLALTGMVIAGGATALGVSRAMARWQRRHG